MSPDERTTYKTPRVVDSDGGHRHPYPVGFHDRQGAKLTEICDYILWGMKYPGMRVIAREIRRQHHTANPPYITKLSPYAFLTWWPTPYWHGWDGTRFGEGMHAGASGWIPAFLPGEMEPEACWECGNLDCHPSGNDFPEDGIRELICDECEAKP